MAGNQAEIVENIALGICLHGSGTGTVLNRTGLDRLLFKRDRSETGPERIQNWACRIGPVLDPFGTGPS